MAEKRERPPTAEERVRIAMGFDAIPRRPDVTDYYDAADLFWERVDEIRAAEQAARKQALRDAADLVEKGEPTVYCYGLSLELRALAEKEQR